MRKSISGSFAALLLTLIMLLALIPQRAEAAGATLSGKSDPLKNGESVTLTLSLNGVNAYGFSGKLNYSDNLSLTNYNCSVSGWSMEVNGGNFSAYGTSPTSGSAVLTLTFSVSSNAAAGAALNASFGDITATDGEKDLDIAAASWSSTVAAALSDNANLSSLSCSNATLSPSFSAGTTYYSTTVPFSVSSLNLSYKTADAGAKASVSGNSLSVGSNTVTITVKAAKGNTKNYTISVTRQQDPNYKPSTDATLSELTLDAAQISPAFNPRITDYVAYVPFETKEVTLSGVAKDEKAIGVTEKTVKLTKEGATPVAVVCTAEDGTTQQTYTVQVFRMPAYEGILPTVKFEPQCDCGAPEDALPGEHAPTCPLYEEPPIPTIDIPLHTTLPLIGECSTLMVAGIGAGLAVLLLLALGFLLGRLIRGSRRDDGDDYDEPEIPKQVAEEIREEIPVRHSEMPADPVEPAPAEAIPVRRKPRFDIQEVTLGGENVVTAPETTVSEANDLLTADKDAESMSLDELLDDIRNM